LRIRIFIAFSLTFLVSFSIILASFHILTGMYLEDTAKQGLIRTRSAIDGAANRYRNAVTIFENRSSQNVIFEEIMIDVLRSRTDTAVNLILTTEEHKIVWPIDDLESRMFLSKSEIQKAEATISYIQNHPEIILSGENPFYYIESENVYVSPVTFVSNSRSFYLFISYDVSKYDEFFTTINVFLLVIMVGTLLLALVSTSIISHSIILSIKRLAAFADRIGKGIFTPSHFDFRDKEMDKLASDMNTMALKIEQANLERQTFFQNASHELRTPLMSIQGYAEGIKYDVFDDPKVASDVIIAESTRLSEMVENLLSISRMDSVIAGKYTIPKSPVDLRELLSSVIEKLQGYAIHENKKILISFPENEHNVMASENDLFRVFQNVLSNCVRYAAENICVEMVKDEKSILVRIKDDGNGIDEELLPYIFERFTKGDGGKHGIGLALSKAILTDHAGSICAENKINGKGAVFTIQLPSIDSF